MKIYTIIFVLLLNVYFSAPSYSQVCGGGILTMEKQNSLEAYLRLYNNSGAEIAKQTAEEIITKSDEILNVRLNTYLSKSNLQINGIVISKLEFHTLELVDFPVIVRISAGKKAIYIIGNFFGNCSRYSSLVWSEKFTRLF
ncbi:MAG TPA: hypothetical protein VGB50_06140 [Flavobacterium sp.]|jgi:hypothetical protein